MLRILRHLFAIDWLTQRRFNAHELDLIETAVRDVEGRQSGEVRVAIETSLDVPDLLRALTARRRALQVFGQLGVWDTADNNGVLIYILMAERDVEIVADRGIAARVSDGEWAEVCRRIEVELAKRHWGAGVAAGVHAVGALLAEHFPSEGGDRDEQPNRPVLI